MHWKKIFLALLVLFVFSVTACVSDPAHQATEVPTTITVKTEPAKTEIVLSSGELTLQGVVRDFELISPTQVLDGPRKYLITLMLDDSQEVYVTYIACPPTPNPRPMPSLNFEGGEINAGNYLVATGTYDEASKTLTVSETNHKIETYLSKP